MSPAELRGAVRMLESIIEIAEEQNDEVVPLDAIKELLEKYQTMLDKAR